MRLRYTFVDLPYAMWECGDCGAFVVQCSVHDDWHNQILALESAFKLLNRHLNSKHADDGVLDARLNRLEQRHY